MIVDENEYLLAKAAQEYLTEKISTELPQLPEYSEFAKCSVSEGVYSVEYDEEAMKEILEKILRVLGFNINEKKSLIKVLLEFPLILTNLKIAYDNYQYEKELNAFVEKYFGPSENNIYIQMADLRQIIHEGFFYKHGTEIYVDKENIAGIIDELVGNYFSELKILIEKYCEINPKVTIKKG